MVLLIDLIDDLGANLRTVEGLKIISSKIRPKFFAVYPPDGSDFSQRKAALKAASAFWDQAALSEAPWLRRRYATKPSPQKSVIIIAHVDGSGTAGAIPSTDMLSKPRLSKGGLALSCIKRS